MIYRNDDPAFENAMDRSILADYESGIVTAKCEFCGESIFENDEYYSNGDIDLCCACYCDFTKVW